MTGKMLKLKTIKRLWLNQAKLRKHGPKVKLFQRKIWMNEFIWISVTKPVDCTVLPSAWLVTQHLDIDLFQLLLLNFLEISRVCLGEILSKSTKPFSTYPIKQNSNFGL